MLFWTVIIALSAGVGFILAIAALRGGQTAEAAGTHDIQVYRDQLQEVDRDHARGVIASEDAERARTEISRRILEVDRSIGGTGASAEAPRGLTWGVIGGLCLVLAGAVVLYARVGVPDFPDLPIAQRIADADAYRASRPDQASAAAAALAEGRVPQPGTADPAFAALMERLRATVTERPGDIQGLELLARNEAALGNIAAALDAQTRLVEVKGDMATADDLTRLAESMIVAAGGYVSPEAETALSRALQRDPTHGLARFYTGLMYAQTGRPDIAFRIWQGILDEGGDAPWHDTIRAEIGGLAASAGVNYTPPPAPDAQVAPRGPDAADVEAAADMSETDRAAMIRGMVDQLSDRLATEGGTAQDWARLITALGVLGETERGLAIWSEAQQVFAASSTDLAMLRDAAINAGLAD